MLLGALLIIPSLDLTATNLTATRLVDKKTWDTYAADAGVQDGLWKVRNNYLPDWLSGKWNESTYSYPSPYYNFDVHNSDIPTNTVPINDRLVHVTIKPIWVLEGLEPPGETQHRTPNDSLLTYGSIVSSNEYDISIFYSGSDNLVITRIGVWLPPGFGYSGGTSNLEKASPPLKCTPQQANHNGGKEITWNYPSGVNYSALPAQGNKKIVTFNFTPTNGNPVDAFSWVRTTKTNPYLSWDTSKKTFEITSAAPSGSAKQTTVVSHSVKTEFQALGGALNGDYQATGITLMRDHDGSVPYPRERLYKETAATITAIPTDATVEKIFLYWSGWKCKPWTAWSAPYSDNATLQLLPAQKGVNKVKLTVHVAGGTDFTGTVTATNIQVMRNGSSSSQHGWSYSCFADITDNVTNCFMNQHVPFYGNATYTVGHWDISSTKNGEYRHSLYTWRDPHTLEPASGSPPNPTLYTRYPLGSPMDGNQTNTDNTSTRNESSGSQDEWAYAAWSVIVIYTSPTTLGHHLYIFDEFKYADTGKPVSYPITGFLAPDDVQGSPTAARITCFVGEGDLYYTGDYLKINGYSMSDGVNPANNVWNSKSNVLGGAGVDGVDIDTFNVGGGTIIKPGDTQADVYMPTTNDSWNLVYTILSFRSNITTGAMIDYNIQ